MADISKCPVEDCSIRKLCYRHTAPNSHHQSWSLPELSKQGICMDFYPRDYPDLHKYVVAVGLLDAYSVEKENMEVDGGQVKNQPDSLPVKDSR